MIDEKKLIKEINKMFLSFLTPDGSDYENELTKTYNEALSDVIETIKEQEKVEE